MDTVTQFKTVTAKSHLKEWKATNTVVVQFYNAIVAKLKKKSSHNDTTGSSRSTLEKVKLNFSIFAILDWKIKIAFPLSFYLNDILLLMF